MLKKVNNLYHITTQQDNLHKIIENGFYPSYAKEHLGEKNILVAMVSFSNILLRDVGESEVISYGKYALGFDRDWGIKNDINPVTYTFQNGITYEVVNAFFYGTLFLHKLERFKEIFRGNSDDKKGKISQVITFSDTPKEVIAILDWFSTNYDEEMFDAVRNYAEALYRKNAAIVALTKPYVIKNNQGQEFIAYNDREWRKIYMALNVIVEGNDKEKNPEYDKWANTDKPHFPDQSLALKFSFDDLKVVMVTDQKEIVSTTDFLGQQYGPTAVIKRLKDGTLRIGTQADLMKFDL